MSKVGDHRTDLARLDDWTAYLAANSNLPGPRGNLELVAAAGEEADRARAEALVATGDEFSVVCGLVAMGRLFGEGDDAMPAVLHDHAPDARWRVREGVAMGFQRAGDAAPERAFALMEGWAAEDDPLVQRAVVAAVCEPRLLKAPAFARRALVLLGRITDALAGRPAGTRRDPEVRTLRQALGYGWSVAVAALPDEGLPAFARLRASPDPDAAWIVRENLKKARLKRLL